MLVRQIRGGGRTPITHDTVTPSWIKQSASALMLGERCAAHLTSLTPPLVNANSLPFFSARIRYRWVEVLSANSGAELETSGLVRWPTYEIMFSHINMPKSQSLSLFEACCYFGPFPCSTDRCFAQYLVFFCTPFILSRLLLLSRIFDLYTPTILH